VCRDPLLSRGARLALVKRERVAPPGEFRGAEGRAVRAIVTRMWHTLSGSDKPGLFHPRSGVQCGERVVDQPIDLDPLAQPGLPAAEPPLSRHPYLAHPRLTRCGFDPVDKGADLLFEVAEVNEQLWLEHHKQVPVVLVGFERRPGEQPEGLHDKGQPKAFVAAEWEQGTSSREGGIACRLAFRIDCYPVR
jgi:hypothetical protein